jgi:predicted permease
MNSVRGGRMTDDLFKMGGLGTYAIALVVGMLLMWMWGYFMPGKWFGVTTTMRQRIANRLMEMRSRRNNRYG